jgi:hypothetical protein
MTRTKSSTNDCFVSEESVLNPGLLMIARLLLPPAATDLLYPDDRAIPRPGLFPLTPPCLTIPILGRCAKTLLL